MADRKAAAQKAAATRKRNREAQIARFGGNPAHTRKVKPAPKPKAAPKPRPTPRPRLPKVAGKAERLTGRVRLTPVGRIDENLLDPYAAPNPRALLELYGPRQVGKALMRYTDKGLTQAAHAVGIKVRRPANRRGTIADIIRSVRHG